MKDFPRNIRLYFSQNGETFNDLNYHYYFEYTSMKTESLSCKDINLNFNLLITFNQKYFFEEVNVDHKSSNYIFQEFLNSLSSRKKYLEIVDRRLPTDFSKKALKVEKTVVDNDQSAKDSNEENQQNTSNNQNSNPPDNNTISTNSTTSSNDNSNTFNFNSNNNGEDDEDENNRDNSFSKSGIQKDKDGRFICSYCLQTFAHVNEYTRHMLNVHNEKVSPYPCHLCKKKFKIEACYWKHMHTHLSNDENLKNIQTSWSSNIKQEGLEQASLLSFKPLQTSGTEQGINLPTYTPTHISPTLNFTSHKPVKNFIINKTPNTVVKNSLHGNNNNNEVVNEMASSSTDAKGNPNLVEGVNVIDNVKGKKIVVYYCAQCNKSYNRQLLYDEHMRVHAGLKPFCCEICGRMFARESNLAGHRQSHKQSKVYRCKVCKVKFSIKQKLVLHEMVHDLEEPFKCHLCIARFVREPDLKEHLLTHVEYSGEDVNQEGVNDLAKSNEGQSHSENQMVSQPIIEEIILDENIICDSMDGQVVYSNVELPGAVYNNDGFLSSTISFLSGHHKEVPQELSREGAGDASFILPPYNDPMQADAKTNDLILKQEVLSDDEKVSKPTDQEDQPTIAKNGERINDVTHYLTPSGKVRPYIFCEVCGQPYKLLREYHDHMRRHTGHKPYCCEVCGKTFHRSKNLSAHRYSHVEVKRHKCDVCGKSFPLSTRLKIHQRIHTGEKPYECELCHKRFIRRNDYMDHRRKHTGGNTCIHCNKKYSKLETLREHINDKHNKVKPIKCKLCDERFSYSVALYRHMKKHRGQEKDLNKKVHFCCLCNKSFTRPCLLKRHMFKTHPQHQETNEAVTAASE